MLVRGHSSWDEVQRPSRVCCKQQNSTQLDFVHKLYFPACPYPMAFHKSHEASPAVASVELGVVNTIVAAALVVFTLGHEGRCAVRSTAMR